MNVSVRNFQRQARDIAIEQPEGRQVEVRQPDDHHDTACASDRQRRASAIDPAPSAAVRVFQNCQRSGIVRPQRLVRRPRAPQEQRDAERHRGRCSGPQTASQGGTSWPLAIWRPWYSRM